MTRGPKVTNLLRRSNEQRRTARDDSEEDRTAAFTRIALRDLRLRLRVMHRTLRESVADQTATQAQSHDAGTMQACLTPEDAETLLLEIDALNASAPAGRLTILTDAERDEQRALRSSAADLGESLPFDRLQRELALSEFDVDAVTVCAAAEIDRRYGRLFGYIVDDMNRQTPSIELFCTLRQPGLEERLHRRAALGRFGALRRTGLLIATEDAARPLRTRLALAEGALERLAHSGTWRDRFYDPLVVEPRIVTSFDCFDPEMELVRLAAGLRRGSVSIAGLWGERASGVDDAVIAVAAAADRTLHRVPLEKDTIGVAIESAKTHSAMLWIHTDGFADPETATPGLEDRLIESLKRAALPTIVSGEYPWRPPHLLATRNFAEVRLASAPGAVRERLWQREFETLDATTARDAAARFRLSPDEVRAVRRVADVRASFKAGRNAADHLESACRQVAQWQGLRFANLVEPRRSAEDLILPDDLHAQVVEIAHFYRSLLTVDEDWGFGRLASGGGGIKALFTGDSGTGKTLAAEVIAKELGLGLLKVDLSRIVSKWVGETEKNLETAFREAEASQTLLFFDEADTLFGKRGEIRGGNDRYANLEVGFLLQRLEQYSGLAVLASNLRDEIDPAFIRRFQVVLHFPRPKEKERRALWNIAFPSSAPLNDEVDLDKLIKLDMTGASIVGAARMAALLAADEGAETICEIHVQEGIRRQYRQEARVLSATAFSDEPVGPAHRR